MNILRRLPLIVQFSLLLIITALVIGFSAYRLGTSIYIGELRNQARTVADMVDNVGQWASKYRGIWVKGDPTNPDQQVGSFLEQEPTVMGPDGKVPDASVRGPGFHGKNPALVQRELADITRTSSSRAKFRMTSDKYMNPDNQPTDFDRAAMQAIRKGGLSEYSETRGSTLYYARRLVADQGCLRCHGSPEAAPEAVRSQYPGPQGYGYQVGQLAGIISVAVPIDFSVITLLNRIDTQIWVAMGISALAVMSLLMFVRWSLIEPIRQVQAFASTASHADLGAKLEKLHFVPEEHRSLNEVHQLNRAVKAMHTSIQGLFRHASQA